MENNINEYVIRYITRCIYLRSKVIGLVIIESNSAKNALIKFNKVYNSNVINKFITLDVVDIYKI